MVCKNSFVDSTECGRPEPAAHRATYSAAQARARLAAISKELNRLNVESARRRLEQVKELIRSRTGATSPVRLSRRGRG